MRSFYVRSIAGHYFNGAGLILRSARKDVYCNILSRMLTSRALSRSRRNCVLVLNQAYMRDMSSSARRNNRGDDSRGDSGDSSDDEEESAENPLLMEDVPGLREGITQAVIEVGSLRLDAFAKVAFCVTRAKIEELFYKGDIYVNGERPPKKSFDLSINDEIDIVTQINPEDHSLVDVKRVQIVKLPDKSSEHNRIKVTINKWKQLTIKKLN